MVAEPCVVPYSGIVHVGSRDRCEQLDRATPIVFRQFDLDDVSASVCADRCFEGEFITGEEDELFVIPEEDMEHMRTHMEEIWRPATKSNHAEWLGEADEVASIINAHPLSKSLSKGHGQQKLEH